MIDYEEEIEVINKIIFKLTSINILDLTNEDIQEVIGILFRYKVLLQQSFILQKRGVE